MALNFSSFIEEQKKKTQRILVMEQLLREFKLWSENRFDYSGVTTENLLNFYHDMANGNFEVSFI